ncbi:MAG: UxaA family hydrolase [Planctomycetes bacterium]|nr:UxaA family hydrolase [Planctomycetota bacterium]
MTAASLVRLAFVFLFRVGLELVKGGTPVVHYIVHGEKDTVGVAVVDLKKGQSLTGWNMAKNSTLRLKAAQNIPLGHKIAVDNIAKGEKVIKYDEEIGNASKAIKKGQHVHTQNLKTARW